MQMIIKKNGVEDIRANDFLMATYSHELERSSSLAQLNVNTISSVDSIALDGT